MANYNEEREFVPALPCVTVLPDLSDFANNGLGVVAFEGDQMVGFLCCYSPWEHAFNSNAIGTFSPIHAHGAIKKNRSRIYQRMYQVAASKWIKHQITYHSIAHYAHDKETLDAFFTYGFGMRCVDAIRPMTEITCESCSGITFMELAKSDLPVIRDLHQMLSMHMGESPCFMYSTKEEYESWLSHAEKRDSRLFVARDGINPVAFVEITDEGENFATEFSSIRNICGAFCLPEYRGKGIYQNLLNYCIQILSEEGFAEFGVDFESFNPTAYHFWTKYFTPYTKSVVRRVDECALSQFI